MFTGVGCQNENLIFKTNCMIWNKRLLAYLQWCTVWANQCCFLHLQHRQKGFVGLSFAHRFVRPLPFHVLVTSLPRSGRWSDVAVQKNLISFCDKTFSWKQVFCGLQKQYLNNQIPGITIYRNAVKVPKYLALCCRKNAVCYSLLIQVRNSGFFCNVRCYRPSLTKSRSADA